MKAYITIGVPGSGKTTWLENNHPEARVASADTFRINADGAYEFIPERQADIHRSCLREFISLAYDGYPEIACDNTNLCLEDVAPYIAIAQANGYEVECIVMSTPEDGFERQIHGVPFPQWFCMCAQRIQLLRNWPKRWMPLLKFPPVA